MTDFSFLETAKGVVPFYEHQMSSANDLSIFSAFLFDMGMKLRQGGTSSQLEKYNALKQAYIGLRTNLSQSYIFEVENNRLLQVVQNQHREVVELRKEVEKLKKILEFQEGG